MNYEKLILSMSLIIENENIETKGLTMVYNLSKEDHINLNVDLYYKTNQQEDFNPEEDFEVVVGDILVKFEKNF